MIKLFKFIPGSAEFGHFNKYEISDGEPVNETASNAAWMSRKEDTNTTGQLDLDNIDAPSGPTIANIQRELNGQDSFMTDSSTTEDVFNRKPSWATNSIGVANQGMKQRIESIQAAVVVSQSDISDLQNDKIDKVNPSTDHSIPRHDGITGVLQDSGVTIDDSNNVIIPGNLQVDGDMTVVNTATLDVEDANITVNKNGNQATANTEVAGITVEMSDATDARMGYDSSLTSKFKVGEVGSESEVATVSLSQVITNKDIDGGTAANTRRITIPQDTKANLDALTRKEGTFWYANDEDKFYGDDGTTLFEIGSGAGSGAGRINFLDTEDSDFENGIGNWAAYDDGGAFVDGTGGAPGSITVSHETGSPLVGDGSLSVNKAAIDASGEGASVASLTIDPQYRGRTVIVELEQDFTDANYPSEDAEIKAYDITNAEIMTIVGDTLIRNVKGKIQVAISTKSNTAQIRLAVHVESDSDTGSSWSGKIDAALLTIDNTAPASIITEWESFTPIGTFTTNTTYTGAKRRVGDSMQVRVHLEFSGAPNATTLTIDVPDSLTIDTAKLPDITEGDEVVLGSAMWRDDSGNQANQTGVVNYASTTTVQPLGQRLSNASNHDMAQINATTPKTWVSGDAISMEFTIPISEWSAGAMLSTTESLFQTVSAKATITAGSHGTSGSWLAISNGSTITIDKDDQSVFDSNGVFTAPKSNWYVFSGAIEWATNSTGVRGARLVTTGSDGGTYNGEFKDASSSFGAVSPVSHTLYLEVGDTVTLEGFQSSGASLSWTFNSSTFQVSEQPDFSVFSVYNETEVLEANDPNIALIGGTSGQYQDLDSLELTPGEWDISAICDFDESGGSITSQTVQTAIGTVAGNDTTDMVTALNRVGTRMLGGTGDEKILAIPPYKRVVTETTTFYLKARGFTSHTNLGARYSFRARKIK